MYIHTSIATNTPTPITPPSVNTILEISQEEDRTKERKKERGEERREHNCSSYTLYPPLGHPYRDI